MMRIWLIRHGMTGPGEEHRYQGSLDEGLSAGGRAALRRAESAPPYVYVSPARRAVETAQILFPDSEQVPVPGLREMNFGDFEGKTWKEMENDARYRAWVDGGCTGTCPGGESRASFSGRVCGAFLSVLSQELRLSGRMAHLHESPESGAELSSGVPPIQAFPGILEEQKARERQFRRAELSARDIFIVAHGGTQMAVLDRWGRPARDYFSWQRPCGCGWLLEVRFSAGGEEPLLQSCLPSAPASSGPAPHSPASPGPGLSDTDLSRPELRVLRELSFV